MSVQEADITLFKAIDLMAWSSGQIQSKLWLCDELSKCSAGGLLPKTSLKIWGLAGWYSLTSFLLFSQGKVNVQKFVSFDIDQKCKDIADRINKAWCVGEHHFFESVTTDINNLDYDVNTFRKFGDPDVIINTSLEAINGNSWWEKIPKSKTVVLQTTDSSYLPVNYLKPSNKEDFLKMFPLQEVYFSGQMHFDFGPRESYNRYMLIGKK